MMSSSGVAAELLHLGARVEDVGDVPVAVLHGRVEVGFRGEGVVVDEFLRATQLGEDVVLAALGVEMDHDLLVGLGVVDEVHGALGGEEEGAEKDHVADESEGVVVVGVPEAELLVGGGGDGDEDEALGRELVAGAFEHVGVEEGGDRLLVGVEVAGLDRAGVGRGDELAAEADVEAVDHRLEDEDVLHLGHDLKQEEVGLADCERSHDAGGEPQRLVGVDHADEVLEGVVAGELGAVGQLHADHELFGRLVLVGLQLEDVISGEELAALSRGEASVAGGEEEVSALEGVQDDLHASGLRRLQGNLEGVVDDLLGVEHLAADGRAGRERVKRHHAWRLLDEAENQRAGGVGLDRDVDGAGVAALALGEVDGREGGGEAHLGADELLGRGVVLFGELRVLGNEDVEGAPERLVVEDELGLAGGGAGELEEAALAGRDLELDGVAGDEQAVVAGLVQGELEVRAVVLLAVHAHHELADRRHDVLDHLALEEDVRKAFRVLVVFLLEHVRLGQIVLLELAGGEVVALPEVEVGVAGGDGEVQVEDHLLVLKDLQGVEVVVDFVVLHEARLDHAGGESAARALLVRVHLQQVLARRLRADRDVQHALLRAHLHQFVPADGDALAERAHLLPVVLRQEGRERLRVDVKPGVALHGHHRDADVHALHRFLVGQLVDDRLALVVDAVVVLVEVVDVEGLHRADEEAFEVERAHAGVVDVELVGAGFGLAESELRLGQHAADRLLEDGVQVVGVLVVVERGADGEVRFLPQGGKLEAQFAEVRDVMGIIRELDGERGDGVVDVGGVALAQGDLERLADGEGEAVGLGVVFLGHEDLELDDPLALEGIELNFEVFGENGDDVAGVGAELADGDELGVLVAADDGDEFGGRVGRLEDHEEELLAEELDIVEVDLEEVGRGRFVVGVVGRESQCVLVEVEDFRFLGLGGTRAREQEEGDGEES